MPGQVVSFRFSDSEISFFSEKINNTDPPINVPEKAIACMILSAFIKNENIKMDCRCYPPKRKCKLTTHQCEG